MCIVLELHKHHNKKHKTLHRNYNNHAINHFQDPKKYLNDLLGKKNNMEGFVVILFNLAHPSKDVVPFLATDNSEYENTLVFLTKQEARLWIDKHKRKPFGYSICDLSDLEIETY